MLFMALLLFHAVIFKLGQKLCHFSNRQADFQQGQIFLAWKVSDRRGGGRRAAAAQSLPRRSCYSERFEASSQSWLLGTGPQCCTPEVPCFAPRLIQPSYPHCICALHCIASFPFRSPTRGGSPSTHSSSSTQTHSLQNCLFSITICNCRAEAPTSGRMYKPQTRRSRKHENRLERPTA